MDHSDYKNSFYVFIPGIAYEVKIKYYSDTFQDELQKVILKLVRLRAKNKLSNYSVDSLSDELGLNNHSDKKVLVNVLQELTDIGKINSDQGLITYTINSDIIDDEETATVWLFYDLLNEDFLDLSLMSNKRLALSEEQELANTKFNTELLSNIKRSFKDKLFHNFRTRNINVYEISKDGKSNIVIEGKNISAVYPNNKQISYPLFLPVRIASRYSKEPMYYFSSPVISSHLIEENTELNLNISNKLRAKFPEIFNHVNQKGKELNSIFLQTKAVEIYSPENISRDIQSEALYAFEKDLNIPQLHPSFMTDKLRNIAIDAEINRIQCISGMNINNEIKIYKGYIDILHALFPIIAQLLRDLYNNTTVMNEVKQQLIFSNLREAKQYVALIQNEYKIFFPEYDWIAEAIKKDDRFIESLKYKINSGILELTKIVLIWICPLLIKHNLNELQLSKEWVKNVYEDCPEIFTIIKLLIEHRNLIVKHQMFPENKISADEFRRYVYLVWEMIGTNVPTGLILKQY